MKRLLFIVLLTFSFQAYAEQWLCITERMMGFYHDQKTGGWEPGAFTDKPKYIVSTVVESGVSSYKVRDHGSKNTSLDCQHYVNKENEYFINCQDKFGSSFLFNKTLNRFQFSNVVGGYVYPYLKNTPPFMAIGLCSSF